MLAHKLIQVSWQGRQQAVAVMDHFEEYFENFSHRVDGQLNDERCPFGVLLWPSARILANQLAAHLPFPSTAVLKIYELGCGVGFLSCALASLLPNSQLIACDYEKDLQAFVELNAKLWGVQSQVQFRHIDWRQACPPAIQDSADWVLGADVFYDASHVTHLPAFAASILKASGRLSFAGPERTHLKQAIESVAEYFTLLASEELYCSTDEDGIEEMMFNKGVREQKITIVHLQKSKS